MSIKRIVTKLTRNSLGYWKGEVNADGEPYATAYGKSFRRVADEVSNYVQSLASEVEGDES